MQKAHSLYSKGVMNMESDIVHMNYCGYDIVENNGEIHISYNGNIYPEKYKSISEAIDDIENNID